MSMSKVHLSSIFYILLLFTIRIILGHPLCSCDLPDLQFAIGVNLIYYKCNNEYPNTIAYPIIAPQDMMKVLEDKRVIFYIFGHFAFPEDPDVQVMTAALCYGRTDNVVLLDWSKHSMGAYKTVFRRAEKVGILLAKGIQLLVNSGLNISKIYIIGHSLGAHVAGFAGKCNDFVIPRITGLDPSNHKYYHFGCYLTSKDAAWMDIIHTDMSHYGTSGSIGTAQYYANGGVRPQPGCKPFSIPYTRSDFCSHLKAFEYYAYTKYLPHIYVAVQCSNCLSYKFNQCSNNLQTGVGYAASDVRGSFYFSTGGNVRCERINKTQAIIA